MVENNIKSETELFSIGDEQKKAEKKDFANFVLPCSQDAWSDLPGNTWKMEFASKKVFLSKQTDSCSEKLLNCALEVLQGNNIYTPYFNAAVLILS